MTLREHTAPLNMVMPIGSPWVLSLLLHSRSVLESVEASDATGAGESIECKTHSLPQPTYISHTPDFRSPSILNFKHLNNDSKLFSDNCIIGKYLTTVPFSSFNLYSNNCSLHPPSSYLAHVLFLPISPFSPHERIAHVSFMLSNLLLTK